MSILEITSLQNPKIKYARSLRDRRDRDREGKFLIEGYREILRAFEAGWEIETLFFCPEFFLKENEPALIKRIAQKGASLLQCRTGVFEKLSYRDRPDGILAIAPQRGNSLKDLVLSKSPFLIVAEQIEKPGNLGTILRSCDAVGADALILCDRCTDLYNPNVVRASVGTLFSVPCFETTSEELLTFLKQKKIAIAAATPHTDNLYTEADFKQPIAIAVGAEQYGLSDLWMEQADMQLSIPMKGEADSLNVASATTLMLYEVLRQRRT